MKNKSKKGTKISRRGLLPLLGGGLLIPFLGFSNRDIDTYSIPKDEEYTTLLKADGTVVRVKNSTINKSKIVKKNISNKSFLNWLGKKL